MQWDIEENAFSEELRVAKLCAPTMEGFVRFQALELLYGGYEQRDVAKISNRSLRTIQRWENGFRERGIDGVTVKQRTGRPRRIPKGRFKEEIVPLVLNPEDCGEDYWTGVKLHGYLRTELSFELCYRTVLNYLHEENFTRLVPRPCPARQDPELRAQFVEEISLLKQDPSVEIWYGDETGVEEDPRPRRVWVKKGSRPTAPYLGDHIRINVVGAVAPERGDFFSLVVPHSDTEIFQIFLNNLAEYTKNSQKKIVLVLDNASWHRSASLNWHHITPKFLPPYSPDLNPIEVLWLCFKQRTFTSWYAKSFDQLLDRTVQGLRALFLDPASVASITSFSH